MWQAFRRSKKDECSKTRDMLSGYMDRGLDPEEEARVEEHLSTCRGCREELESLRATVALLRHMPEVTPSKSFAVAPVKPLPGRRALPALRLAAAGAVVLLVLAFAADWTGLFQGGIVSNPRYGADTLDFGNAEMIEEGESYWVVAGAANSLSDNSAVPVDLVVPDHTDNVQVALESLETNGIMYATSSVTDEGPQLVLTEGVSGTGAWGEPRAYSVVSADDAGYSPFATNDSSRTLSFKAIIDEQDGVFLNMVPATSDNSVLYSFPLGDAHREVKPADDDDWLRFLELNLIALVVVLGGATAALWLRRRRARAAEASYNRR